MDSSYINQLLAGTISIDGNVRQNAEKELQNLESQPGFLPSLLQTIMNPQVDPSVLQAGAILFKNSLRKGWDSKIISDEDKEVIRQNILQASVHAGERVKVHIETCIFTILYADHNEGKWDSFIPSAMQLVQAADPQSNAAGVSAIFNLTKCYRWGVSETKAVKKEQIVTHILPHLHPIALKYINNSDPVSGYIVKTVLKSYSSMVKVKLPKQLQTNDSLMPWGTLFIQVIEKDISSAEFNMPEDSSEKEKHIWWKAKKWAFSCINTLFCRYATDLTDSDYKEFSALFRTHYSTRILEVYMGQIAKIISNVYMSNRCKLMLANFLKDSICIKETWKSLKVHVGPLIQHFIYPLLCFTDEDEELWEFDPVEYVRKKIDNPFEDIKSPAKAAEELLSELCKSRFKHTFMIIIQFINEALTNYASLPDNQKQPRLKDGALNMLCTIATYTMKKKSPIKDQIDSLLKTFVLVDLKSPFGFLRARACNTLRQFGEADLKEDTVHAAFQGILDLLQDKELPVRVTAALSLQSFIFSPFIYEAIKPHVSNIMQAFLNISNEVDLDVLTEVMESIVADFAEELTPFATQLTGQLMESFTRLLKEMNLNNDEAEYDQATEDRVFAAQGILRTLITLSFSMEVSPQIQHEMENIICPILAVVLEKTILDLYEETFELIETIIYCSKAVTPTMWQLFPHIYQTYKQDAADYIDIMENTLDNMMTYGHEYLVHHETEREQMFDIMCNTLLPNQLHITNANRIAACQLLQSFMLNLRGKIDSYLPRIIEIGLSNLQGIKKKSLPTVKVVFIEVIVNAIYYNPAVTLQVLEQNNATNAFFTLWLQNIALFSRVHDKKLSILAILSIVQLPQQSIPASFGQDGLKHILNSLIEIFESYPLALHARQEEITLNLNDDYDLDVNDDYLDDDDVEEAEEDGDVVDKEELAYLEILAKRAQEIQEQNADSVDVGLPEEEDDDDEEYDWEIEDLSEDIHFVSPLDEIDAYIAFEQLAQQRNDIVQMVQSVLPQDKQSFIQDIAKAADEQRRKAAEEAQKKLQQQQQQQQQMAQQRM